MFSKLFFFCFLTWTGFRFELGRRPLRLAEDLGLIKLCVSSSCEVSNVFLENFSLHNLQENLSDWAVRVDPSAGLAWPWSFILCTTRFDIWLKPRPQISHRYGLKIFKDKLLFFILNNGNLLHYSFVRMRKKMVLQVAFLVKSFATYMALMWFIVKVCPSVRN